MRNRLAKLNEMRYFVHKFPGYEGTKVFEFLHVRSKISYHSTLKGGKTIL